MSIEADRATIGDRLARNAGDFPDRVALSEGASRVTYGELDQAATSIARKIVSSGRERAGRVAIFCESRMAAIEAIVGAARSGYAYVPLDAGDPEERLRSIVADSEPVAILAERALIDRARAIAPPRCATIDIADAKSYDADHSLPGVDADAPLYLYYTSGSTGRPKGTIQTHRNVQFFFDAYARMLAIDGNDRLSLLYTLSFNAANTDIYGALLHGATLCAYDVRRQGIGELADWLDRERVTVLHTVPTLFRELFGRLVPGRFLPHLRVVDLGGEAVFGSDVDHFRAHAPESCVFVNQLASTEVGLIAQHAIRHDAPRDPAAIVPVGRCPDGVRVEIRRADDTPAAQGEVGEIIVTSRHVSPGYWRRPEQDAAAFRIDPLSPDSRSYASGDLGTVDAAGLLHFIGRKGTRVKVRGHSVDLMEVEAALSECQGIAKAAVISAGAGALADSARLVAYVVADRGEDRDPQVLRRRLALRVPAYMLPAAFVFVDDLPLTVTGKVDRQALAAIAPSESPPERAIDPPRDDVEREVAAIFGQLLELDAIGRDDDFFLLGGDSLRGVELQLRLRGAFGVHVGNFHSDATVARIAAGVRHDRAHPSAQSRAMPVLLPLWPQGREIPLFLVHGRHGQAFVSPHFMRLLGDDQPVWAFQARGLDGQHPPHATIEAMAADYLAEMRAVRPRGPYFIGALCAGAYIAAAMARLLVAAGETVLPLLLLDPPERLLQGGYGQMSEERFIAKMSTRRARGGTIGPNDPEYLRTVRRVALAFEQAIAAYRPQPYSGAAYMLSSRARMQGNAGGLAAIVSGAIERFEVGSTHADALDPRNPLFASSLLRCLGLIRGAGQGRSAQGPASSDSAAQVHAGATPR